MSLGSLGWYKSKNKSQLETGIYFIPLFKGDIRYWLNNRFLRLVQIDLKSWYADVDLATMDNNIDGMGIQNLMALVIKHEEYRHILENVTIGERNPKYLSG